MNEAVVAALVGAAVAGGTLGIYMEYRATIRIAPQAIASTSLRTIQLPTSLSTEEARGERIFRRTCETCHGRAAVGGAGGPGLVEIPYGPDMLPDKAFLQTLAAGGEAHQDLWTEEQAAAGRLAATATATDHMPHRRAVLAYIRAVQSENDID